MQREVSRLQRRVQELEGENSKLKISSSSDQSPNIEAFARGDKVSVWSATQKKYFDDGVVVEASAEGGVCVEYNVGATKKRVPANAVGSMLLKSQVMLQERMLEAQDELRRERARGSQLASQLGQAGAWGVRGEAEELEDLRDHVQELERERAELLAARQNMVPASADPDASARQEVEQLKLQAAQFEEQEERARTDAARAQKEARRQRDALAKLEVDEEEIRGLRARLERAERAKSQAEADFRAEHDRMAEAGLGEAASGSRSPEISSQCLDMGSGAEDGIAATSMRHAEEFRIEGLEQDLVKAKAELEAEHRLLDEQVHNHEERLRVEAATGALAATSSTDDAATALTQERAAAEELRDELASLKAAAAARRLADLESSEQPKLEAAAQTEEPWPAATVGAVATPGTGLPRPGARKSVSAGRPRGFSPSPQRQAADDAVTPEQLEAVVRDLFPKNDRQSRGRLAWDTGEVGVFLDEFFTRVDAAHSRLPATVYRTMYDQAVVETGGDGEPDQGLDVNGMTIFAKSVHDFTCNKLSAEQRRRRSTVGPQRLSALGTLVAKRADAMDDPAGGGGAVPREGPPPRLKGLWARSVKDNKLTLTLLAGAGELDAEVLRWASRLSSPNPEVAAEAAAKIGGFGARSGPLAKTLANYLKDADSHVREEVAAALIAMGPAAGGASEKLVTLLQHHRSFIREQASAVLKKLGGACSRSAGRLVTCLTDSRDEVRVDAATILSLLGSSAAPYAAQLAVVMVIDPNWVVRKKVCTSFGDFGQHAVPHIAEIEKLLQDEDKDVQKVAQKTLDRIRGEAF